MSKKQKWLEQAEKAEELLWDLYDNKIEGDDSLGMYSLSAFRSVNSLCDYLEKEIENE